MEKTFHRMTTRPSARHAYVSAEIATALATQIRNLRMQRGWTQRELARRLDTTQNAISRMEDPSYGRLSLQTLLQLSRVFDTGLQVRFVSLVKMLNDTFHPQPAADLVPPFEEEAPHVAFVANGRSPHTVQHHANAVVLASGMGQVEVQSFYQAAFSRTQTSGSTVTADRVARPGSHATELQDSAP